MTSRTERWRISKALATISWLTLEILEAFALSSRISRSSSSLWANSLSATGSRAQDSLKQPIGKPIEQPYRRREDQIEEPQRPADPQSRRYGLADSERFRRQFPQNDMKDRDGAKG